MANHKKCGCEYYFSEDKCCPPCSTLDNPFPECDRLNGEAGTDPFPLRDYFGDEIKRAILNNDPVEEKLHVIVVISNPCNYKRRYQLAKEFIKRILQEEESCELYVVELTHVFPDGKAQPFMITSSSNPKHLQLRTSNAMLWHKENMINLGIRKLLPSGWKAVAWVDADIEFDTPHWATDALKILNGCRDVIQLFSQAIDMDVDGSTLNIFSSFGFQYSKRRPQAYSPGINYWHPGYAWAMTRKAYEKLGGLYQLSILGSGDYNMAKAFIGRGLESIHSKNSEGYKKSIIDYELKARNLRLGYVPGVIRHYFHGQKKNRKYIERGEILVKHQFSPLEFLKTDDQGLLIPTEKMPKEMLGEIQSYFQNRNEDECFSNR